MTVLFNNIEKQISFKSLPCPRGIFPGQSSAESTALEHLKVSLELLAMETQPMKLFTHKGCVIIGEIISTVISINKFESWLFKIFPHWVFKTMHCNSKHNSGWREVSCVEQSSSSISTSTISCESTASVHMEMENIFDQSKPPQEHSVDY